MNNLPKIRSWYSFFNKKDINIPNSLNKKILKRLEINFQYYFSNYIIIGLFIFIFYR